jgi:hypothetical protein
MLSICPRGRLTVWLWIIYVDATMPPEVLGAVSEEADGTHVSAMGKTYDW